MSKNVELLKSGYEAFARGDVEYIVSNVLDPEIEWREPEIPRYPIGGVYRGPDAVVQGVFAQTAELWDDFSVEPEEYLDAGDTVVVTGRYRGRARATGKALDAPFAAVWKFHYGRIVEGQEYPDTNAVREALT
jgi:ketosteroid isomerase-like protein